VLLTDFAVCSQSGLQRRARMHALNASANLLRNATARHICKSINHKVCDSSVTITI